MAAYLVVGADLDRKVQVHELLLQFLDLVVHHGQLLTRAHITQL
jgi:hypothetical protein